MTGATMEKARIRGRVVAVRGPVVDAAFAGPPLPAVNDALHILDGDTLLIAEVQSHLDEQTVRAVALQATGGLSRGGGPWRRRGHRSACRSARRCSAAC